MQIGYAFLESKYSIEKFDGKWRHRTHPAQLHVWHISLEFDFYVLTIQYSVIRSMLWLRYNDIDTFHVCGIQLPL